MPLPLKELTEYKGNRYKLVLEIIEKANALQSQPGRLKSKDKPVVVAMEEIFKNEKQNKPE